MTVDDLEVEMDGRIHPCNGYILVEKFKKASDIVVIEFNESYRCAIVVETSDDETDGALPVDADSAEWRKGDLIYFRDSIEVDGVMLVHWTDVVAYRRF